MGVGYLLGLLYLLEFCVTLKAAEVYVDATNGNDEECSSLQELLTNVSSSSTTPCKTLNSALGNTSCSRNCTSDIPLLDSIVKLSDGVHTLTGCVAILGGSNVTIEAQNIGKATVFCVGHGTDPDNIQSCMTQGLTFRGINFEGCGPAFPNVFLNRSNNVLFEDCTFKGNTGPPLRLQFVPSIKLLRTSFLNNRNQISGRQDNENTTISELFGSITTSGGFTYFSQNASVEIVIEDCMFINNSADADSSIDRPVLLKADGHGGGVLIRLTDVFEARIQVTNSLFESNQAGVDGAGVYFSLSDFSSSSVYLYNNTFRHNTVTESTGGALSLNLFSFSLNNSFILEGCRFINNSASAGGAVSITQYDSTVSNTLPQDKAAFVKCDFEDNRAMKEGTAVGLFSLVGVEQFGFPVDFVNWYESNYLKVSRLC